MELVMDLMAAAMLSIFLAILISAVAWLYDLATGDCRLPVTVSCIHLKEG